MFLKGLTTLTVVTGFHKNRFSVKLPGTVVSIKAKLRANAVPYSFARGCLRAPLLLRNTLRK
jgi:hypothetical protein